MEKENATCCLTSFHRSDHLLSLTSVGDHDEETLLHLQESCIGDAEVSRHGSGWADWKGDVSLMAMKGTATSPLYSSDPGGYGYGMPVCCETETAVAGIPVVPSSSSLRSASMTNSVHCYHSNDACFPSNHSCRGSSPLQVEDDGEQLDWNPVHDIMHRIKSKIIFLTKSKLLPELDVKLLLSAEGNV